MPRIVDRIGDRYGRLTVVAQAGRSAVGGNVMWLCRCDCGNVATVNAANLAKGSNRSCGRCLREDHGMTHSPTWESWQAMKQRCTNPRTKSWRWYGGRGITVCDRWLSSFGAFLQDMGVRPEGTTLDRIDSDDHYRPGNCRWATRPEQSANQRRRGKATAP